MSDYWNNEKYQIQLKEIFSKIKGTFSAFLEKEQANDNNRIIVIYAENKQAIFDLKYELYINLQQLLKAANQTIDFVFILKQEFKIASPIIKLASIVLRNDYNLTIENNYQLDEQDKIELLVTYLLHDFEKMQPKIIQLYNQIFKSSEQLPKIKYQMVMENLKKEPYNNKIAHKIAKKSKIDALNYIWQKNYQLDYQTSIFRLNNIEIYHVLGPKGTDSYETLYDYLTRQNKQKLFATKIAASKSFAIISEQISYKNKGHLVWLPLAMRAQGIDIGTLIYAKNSQLQLIETLAKPTKEMVIIENLSKQNNKVVLQPATQSLFLTNRPGKWEITAEGSKKTAYQTFKRGNHRYCISSIDEDMDFDFEFTITNVGAYNMIWLKFLIV